MGLKSLLYSVTLGLVVLINAPALAHKVIISAFAEGDIIEGDIGFSNGDMAINSLIEVLDQDGNVIDTTMTDGEGIFQYKPTKAVPLTFKANLGQGHVAIYTLPVDELPAIVKNAVSETNDSISDGNKAGAIAGNFKGDSNGVSIDPGRLSAQIREAVKLELAGVKSEIASAIRKDIKPLRKEITAYKEKNDFQTILGGIGYIAGLFGLGFYFAARRERMEAKKLKSKTATS